MKDRGVWLFLRLLLLSLVAASAAFAPDAIGSQQRTFPCGARAAAVNLAEEAEQDDEPAALTSALLCLGYDGGRFSGWTAGNDVVMTRNATQVRQTHAPRSSQRRRNRNLYSANAQGGSVAGVLQLQLAKLYGNIDPQRIVVEGSSRTDRGVHARGAVAHVYGLRADWNDTSAVGSSSLPGKRLPHPLNATDATAFLPLPMTPAKLAFCLNQMLPPDVRVMLIAALSSYAENSINDPFHASQSATAKTYVYRLGLGARADPLGARFTWQASRRTTVDEAALAQAVALLTRGPQNFAAFCGAPRGASDKAKRRRQNTTCHVSSITWQREEANPWLVKEEEASFLYSVTLTGDRFLYKMVRFLVGSLVAVALGQLTVDDLRAMLESGQRPLAFSCAPAHGLALEQVHYDNHEIDWQIANS